MTCYCSSECVNKECFRNMENFPKQVKYPEEIWYADYSQQCKSNGKYEEGVENEPTEL